MIQEMSLNSFGKGFAAFVPKPSVEDIKLANALADDAEQNAVEAGRQQKYAEMAQSLIINAENDESRTELTQIAVWHYKLCGTSFRQSVVGFESAAKIQKDQKLRRKLLKKAETMAEFAMQTELSMLELRSEEKKRRIE